MQNWKGPIKGLIIIFMLSLILRLLVIIIYPNIPISTDAINDYIPIAKNLVAGNGFVRSIGHPDIIRGPGVPLFISAIFLLFGKSFIAIKIAQIILDSMTIILSMILSWILFNTWDRAYIAGIILAFYPIMIYSSNQIGVETLFCFTFILSITIFIIGVRREKVLLYFISGVMIAFTTMVRSTPLLFPLVIGIWLVSWNQFKKKYIYYYFLLCFGFVMALSPWAIRNFIIFHEFIPTVANGGNNFQAGSSIKYMVPLKERIEIRKSKRKEYKYENEKNKKFVSPKEWDAYMWRIGWKNYRIAWERNPLDVGKLLLYKAARFWYATNSGKYQVIIFFIQIPFIILASIGLRSIIKSNRYSYEIWLMVMSILYFWGIFVVMFPLARYTVPILPFLAIFISGLYKRNYDKIKL